MKMWTLIFVLTAFSLSVNLSYAQEYSVDNNTVALWHFSEGIGNSTKDETGRFNGTIRGANWTSTGNYGNALYFDGIDDSVTIYSNASEGLTNKITLEAWIYPTKYGRIVGRYESGSLSYLLTVNNQVGLYINSQSHSNSAWSNSIIPLNNWTHVAATYDGSVIKIYINGSLDSTTNKNLGNII